MTAMRSLVRLAGACLISVSINGCGTIGRITDKYIITEKERLMPVLTADLQENVLSLKLTNFSQKAIRVDRELVFLVSIVPIDSEGKEIPLKEFSTLPPIDPKLAKRRFCLLQPGASIERKIDLSQPFRQFVCGVSDTMRITAYEELVLFPQAEEVAAVQVIYLQDFYLYREALEWYLGQGNLGEGHVPKDLFVGPLECTVHFRR